MLCFYAQVYFVKQKTHALFLCTGLKSISRCSKLSSLKLGICLNITDKGLAQVGFSCSKLNELDLYRFLSFSLLSSLLLCGLYFYKFWDSYGNMDIEFLNF